MTRTLLIFLFCGLSVFSMAQLKQEYLLEKNSNSILLSDETQIELNSISSSITLRKYSAVIKNKRAQSLRNVGIYYDQFQKVKDAEVIIKNSKGEKVNSYKLKDFDDIGLGLSSTASDGRLKLLEPVVAEYPYIIEVSYSIEKEGSLHFPIWRPQDEERMRVLEASFKVIDKTKSGFRFQQYNLPQVTISEEDHGKIYTWTAKDIEPFIYEYFNYDYDDYAPVVYTAPNQFEIDGFEGDMSSWSSFGIWAHKLNQGKNDLDETQLKELDSTIGQLVDTLDKIAAVYNFLQSNSRYVSIQLGIGGWQPFPASYVQNKKYGDCKALSYFTKVLLDRYGINSYYTLIKAGSYASEVSEDFPNAHFNHAIVTVPIKQDTIFLECTSQTNPFGYLGKFTSDRNALLITPNGGKLIHTKKYSAIENLQTTKTQIEILEDGSSQVSIKRVLKGLEVENHSFLSLYNSDKTKLTKWAIDNHKWGINKMESFSLIPLEEGVIPKGGYVAVMSNSKEGKQLGKRLFLDPGKYTRSYLSKLTSTERKQPIKIKYGYTQIDSIVYDLPVNMIIENESEDIILETKFGNYQRSVNKDSGKVILQREFKLNNGEYSIDDYNEFKEFVNSVIKHDNEQIVLLEKT